VKVEQLVFLSAKELLCLIKAILFKTNFNRMEQCGYKNHKATLA
jgi:hypothetical protein